MVASENAFLSHIYLNVIHIQPVQIASHFGWKCECKISVGAKNYDLYCVLDALTSTLVDAGSSATEMAQSPAQSQTVSTTLALMHIWRQSV